MGTKANSNFYRLNGLISIEKLRSTISLLMIDIVSLKNEFDGLEHDIIQGYHFSDIPKDTSKLNDEVLIGFIERRNRLIKEIEDKDKQVKNTYLLINKIQEMINNLPDCFYKKVMILAFSEGHTAKEISYQLGCSLSNVYKFTNEMQKALKRIIAQISGVEVANG